MIVSLTIPIPLSSDAFSSITLSWMTLGPKSCDAIAKIVDVFPVPGGPKNNKCGNSPVTNVFLSTFTTSSCWII
jgi:hypothetical protein